jgi:hypothetical protein
MVAVLAANADGVSVTTINSTLRRTVDACRRELSKLGWIEHGAAGSIACIQKPDAEDFSRLLRRRRTAKRKEHDAKSKAEEFFSHAFSPAGAPLRISST